MTKTWFFRFTVAVLLLTGLIAQRAPTAQAAGTTATSSAEMVTPLVIVFQDPLDFGDFTVGATGGTSNVSPDAFAPKSTTGDVTWFFPSSAGRGTFGLSGGLSKTYQNAGSDISVTLNGQTGPAVGNSMTATLTYYSDTGTSLVTGAGGGLLHAVTGLDVLGVGGILTVAPNQPSGAYKGSYNITVNY